MNGPRMTEDRFWSLVNHNGPVVRKELGPCWIWSGKIRKDEYGRISSEKWGTRLAHRVAALLSGIIVDCKKDALHKCDNRACCNPSHLYSGNDSDNNKDAFSRGRRTNNGSHNPNARLNESQVLEIRNRNGTVTHKQLAKEYGVSESLIEKIIGGKNWIH